MDAFRGTVLPYRTDGEDLVRLLEARARGRTIPQIRTLNFSAKNFEGTLLTAQALGLLDQAAEELTDNGRRFALAPEGERQELLHTVLTAFEPYALLLEAISARKPTTATLTDWIERWWATHGYGSSESNRAEAAATFGRLVEFAGWGSYVPGRRGHPTRIEWREGAKWTSALRGGVPSAEPLHDAVPAAPARPPVTSRAAQEPAPFLMREALDAYSTAILEVRTGQTARIRVPSTLTRAEKERLLRLLDLLIRVVPDD